MISIKSDREISLMREAGRLNYLTHEEVKKHIKPGVKTKDLDKVAYDFIIKNHAKPSFLNYEGYPASICVSINDEVVHGIPSSHRIIQEGDIVSVDVGAYKNGFHGDAARTFLIGDVSEDKKKLVQVTKQCFFEGINGIKNGSFVGDISSQIQKYAESFGYSVIRLLEGHGVGRNLHEYPSVPNYGRAGSGAKLLSGMTIAIEPMINLGKKEIVMLDDDWTIVTKDGLPSAHYENTVLITDDGVEILTL